jgi:hypothetical protein
MACEVSAFSACHLFVHTNLSAELFQLASSLLLELELVFILPSLALPTRQVLDSSQALPQLLSNLQDVRLSTRTQTPVFALNHKR